MGLGNFEFIIPPRNIIISFNLLQIIDGVVAAHILNAVFVVPKLDQKSFWKDSRSVSLIFAIYKVSDLTST